MFGIFFFFFSFVTHHFVNTTNRGCTTSACTDIVHLLRVPTLQRCVVVCVARASSAEDNNWVKPSCSSDDCQFKLNGIRRSEFQLGGVMDCTINLLLCVDGNGTYSWMDKRSNGSVATEEHF